jgi:hypothetical protein
VADVAVGSYLLYVPQFFSDVSFARWPNISKAGGNLGQSSASTTHFIYALTPLYALY